ncbi:MAG TPA: ion transporter, partial [Pyrinomonadaceae bacterium]
RETIDMERREILSTLESWLETPLLVLGFVWLALLIAEFVWGENAIISAVSNAIWVIFIVDFAVRFLLAPAKIEFLKSNWITAIALALPALRILRIFRAVRIFQATRVVRSVRLVRVLTSVNRGLKALGESLGRRGFPYVLAATLIVIFAGAAGMLVFERDVPDTAIESYGSAVWFTAMLITSIGTDYAPRTDEGRILTFLIALYGFIVFGYITATLATLFVEQDSRSTRSPITGKADIQRIEDELIAIRRSLQQETPT